MFAIYRIGDRPTVRFAADELSKYLSAMTGNTPLVESREGYDASQVGIWLGTADAFPGIEMPPVADREFDDAVCIHVDRKGGIIAGSNPRSVLLAVYRYLHELGCRWVRPGPDGEFVPRRDPSDLLADVSEAASYRHRGICIEGAVSREHVLDIIDWAPKAGFNAYFTQFREAHTFFDRWYSNQPDAKPFTIEDARAILRVVVQEIEKRDLLYHAVGHGWTCEPFGVAGLGWDQRETATPEVAKYLALVNGKRDFWGGVPLNTNLCYSNPEVRRIIVNEIASYSQTHPEIDLLHFWLADGSNNQCECEECSKARPADFYVKMLNELDDELTARGLPTRIVFLIYVDLLWPPEVETIRNPDRFVLMFAPITRTYLKTFSPESDLPEIPPYQRNRLDFPRSVEMNVAFLKSWQAIFGGDSFDFDYHFMWHHYKDPGYLQVAEVLHGDCQQLSGIGLNGLVSCQVQRAFFPHGLGMNVMGWTLWDKARDFGKMAKDYFRAAFGPDGEKALEYMRNLSASFVPVFALDESELGREEQTQAISAARDAIDAFRPVVRQNMGADNPCHATSWKLLDCHADIWVELADALEARVYGDGQRAWEKWERVKTILQDNKNLLDPVLDTWEFVHVLGGRFPKP